jgi:hypothetical protein
MNWKRKRNAWVLASAVGLAISGGALASGSTPTWEEALASSPNRLTAAEQADLERRAASGESALQAPAGTYSPSAAGRMSTYGGAVTNPHGSNMESSADGTSSASSALEAAPSGDALSTGSALGDARRADPAVPATPATPAVPGSSSAVPATPATPAVPSHRLDASGSTEGSVAPRTSSSDFSSSTSLDGSATMGGAAPLTEPTGKPAGDAGATGGTSPSTGLHEPSSTDAASSPANGASGANAMGDDRRATPAVPATPAEPGVTSATPATPAIPSDKADSRDDSIRNDIAPRDRKLPADRPRG